VHLKRLRKPSGGIRIHSVAREDKNHGSNQKVKKIAMSQTEAPGTIHISPKEAERIQTRIKNRRQQCKKSVGQAREPTEKGVLHQHITMLNLNNDMDLMGGGGGQESEGITVLPIEKPYLPSTASLDELTSMRLSELKMETHHKGRKLSVRRKEAVVEQKAHTWTAVEEEGSEDVERLEIVVHKSRGAEDLLDSIKAFTIKEPYFTLSDDNEPTLRIDHPSDIVIHSEDVSVGADASAVERATKCKEEGNAALKRKELLDAHARYTEGLLALTKGGAADDKLARDIHRNRAHVNLQLNRMDEAKTDGIAAVTGIDDERHRDLDSKAYFRAARAAYNLGQWQEAKDLFEKQKSLAPGDKDAATNLEKLATRLHEQQTGEYDFNKIRSGLSKLRPRADAADYDGNTERRESKGHGYGLFATKDIDAGLIILCEKALCIVWSHEADGWTALTVDARDSQTRVQPVGLTKAIVAKLMANPSQIEKATSLFGDHKGLGKQLLIKDGTPVVDTFQIHDIVSRNAFGPGETFVTGKQDGRKASTGLWVRSAYINHSCIPNAKKDSVGDLMIFRATRPIKAGEEIFHCYSESIDLKDRAANLEKTWGFVCDCRLCKAEKKDGAQVREKRLELMGQAEALMQRDDVRIAKRTTVGRLETVIKELNETYNEQRYQGIPRYGVERIQEWMDQAKRGQKLK
jgi:tetratricopeptide (TPR) repeat protein